MKPSDHPLHTSNTETKLQWIAIACMAFGLMISAYFHSTTLKAERIKSELSSYLHLNDRYHTLLFNLIQNDPDVFHKTSQETLQKNKYVMYELFELFETIDMLEHYFKELDKDVWPYWKRRIEFLFSKPAIRYAWAIHFRDAEKIYNPQFMQFVENIIEDYRAHGLLEEVTQFQIANDLP